MALSPPEARCLGQPSQKERRNLGSKPDPRVGFDELEKIVMSRWHVPQKPFLIPFDYSKSAFIVLGALTEGGDSYAARARNENPLLPRISHSIRLASASASCTTCLRAGMPLATVPSSMCAMILVTAFPFR